jgi:hypothetical protein
VFGCCGAFYVIYLWWVKIAAGASRVRKVTMGKALGKTMTYVLELQTKWPNWQD